jgi:hypothetical protein
MFLLGVAPALLTLWIKPSVGTIAGRSLKYQAYKPLAAGTGEGQRSTSCLECKLPGGAMWTAAIKASLSSNFAASRQHPPRTRQLWSQRKIAVALGLRVCTTLTQRPISSLQSDGLENLSFLEICCAMQPAQSQSRHQYRKSPALSSQ